MLEASRAKAKAENYANIAKLKSESEKAIEIAVEKGLFRAKVPIDYLHNDSYRDFVLGETEKWLKTFGYKTSRELSDRLCESENLVISWEKPTK